MYIIYLVYYGKEEITIRKVETALAAMRKKTKIKPFSIITVLLCACVVFLLIGSIAKEASELSAKKQEKAQLETQLAEQNAENEAMADKLSNGDTDELKEQIAREDGYIKPDEQLVIDVTPGV
jgi:cell division protein FtsB